ncbi:MAG TPA: DUF4349 domain-containing protein [Novosphingobium sp.]|nr:DUF4349 domain-containing protein [Novosphingobium sp.]
MSIGSGSRTEAIRAQPLAAGAARRQGPTGACARRRWIVISTKLVEIGMRWIVPALAAALLAGCSESPSSTSQERVAAYDVAEAPASAADAASEAATAAGETAAVADAPASLPNADSRPIPTAASQPKIAYIYKYGYRLATERVAQLQKAHADYCEKQGPRVCRILDMRQSGAEGDYASGSLALAVAASRARAFGVELSRLAESAGGKEISAAITGEDLSKQMVDTEARLRARTLLRDRLMEVLATRKGTVAELVEAERSVAQVNEEIDEARAWLEEMRGRVDFSRVNIAYSSGAPAGGGFSAPIRGALGSMGSILGVVVAALIVALTVALPLLLIVFGVLWVRRRWREGRFAPLGIRGQPAAEAEEPA